MKPANVVDIKRQHTGIMQSLIQEFEQHRLPRLFRLKDKVARGEPINDVDLDFLCRQMKDASLAMHMTVNYPDLQEFCMTMAHLYKDICDEAMQNEPR